MAITYTKGSTGILSVNTTGATYLPIVCLTSTSLSTAIELLEKISMCNSGIPEKMGSKVTSTLQCEAFVTTGDTNQEYGDVMTLFNSKAKKKFKLAGRGADLSFNGLITSISDSYSASDDATFSFTIQVDWNVE